MGLAYSTYQIALFDFTLTGKGSAIVDAKAGSGKTTSIIEVCNRLPDGASVLFLAFNKSIVEELKAKLPAGINCSTFNSCGWGSWRRYTGKRFIKVDGKKTWRIIWDTFTKDEVKAYGAFVAKMVGLAKSTGLVPEDDDSKWFKIQDHHGLTLASRDGDYNEAIDLSKQVLKQSIRKADDVCDFDDQLYMPWLRNTAFDQFDVVFIDEAQDTNPVQVALLKRMLKTGGRLIAVGDPQQAIYGFRGADHEAMNNIKEAFDCTTLPLSISYRCAKSIIKEAQKYVPGIEAFDSSPEGEVSHLDDYDINTFTANDAILCRNNAPLIEIAYQFIGRGKSVNFLGRDIGAGLKSLIKNMEARNLDDLSIKLDAWLERESEKLRRKHQEDKIELLQDRINCIEIFIQYLPQSRQTVGDLLAAIDNLFKSNGRGITLSSVHKSKGKEWNRVFILDFEKYMPSRWAKKDWQKIQENNLIYVAITRAKDYVGYIPSNSWTDEPNMVIPERQVKLTKPTKPARVGGLTGFNPFANK